MPQATNCLGRRFQVKRGATRLVVLVGRLAIKIPNLAEWRTCLWGLLANMQERTFAATGNARLARVLWSLPGGFLVVMERCRPLDDAEWQALDVDAFEWGGDMRVPIENKRDAFGVSKDGRLVAVDFGS